MYLKSAWIRNCFRNHVVFFHCIVSRLVMCHSRVFSLGFLEILNRCIVLPSLKCPGDASQSRFQSRVSSFRTLEKMSPRVYNARKIFLHEKCVDVKLLWISCSFLPLHHLAFSSFPQSHFKAIGA